MFAAKEDKQRRPHSLSFSSRAHRRTSRPAVATPSSAMALFYPPTWFPERKLQSPSGIARTGPAPASLRPQSSSPDPNRLRGGSGRLPGCTRLSGRPLGALCGRLLVRLTSSPAPREQSLSALVAGSLLALRGSGHVSGGRCVQWDPPKVCPAPFSQPLLGPCG